MVRGLLGSGGIIVMDNPDAYRKQYYTKNKDRIRKYQKQYYQKNKDKIKEYQIKYYASKKQ